MDDTDAVRAFAALSQLSRLQVLRNLVIAGPEGLAAGRIAELVGVSPSNISFHLKEMEYARLIKVRRKGRSLVYSARYDTVTELLRFMVKDCCSGDPVLAHASNI